MVNCYLAWSSQLESGPESMTDAQIANARVWRDAWDHASDIATPLLSQPQTTAFRFELF